MPVQDDERERELVRMFNLNWDPAHQRAGVDAVLDVEVNGENFRFDVEVKSSTGTTVSTARDVGMDHIKKWRRMLFVIGFYSKEARRPELQHCLCLTPVDMEPWIASIEAKISIDFKLALWASRRLLVEDLYEVCGEQESYSIEDAKRLHKQQWTADEYQAALDLVVDGKPRISPQRMLEILQLRLQYIAQRGATLNNPHITKTHLSSFEETNRVVKGPNWAAGVRAIAEDFVINNPQHPGILKI
ncbi:hypothetical protein [Acidovorax radicis]|jgi:hypothetical protein|uniref:hypothetical protein n=1 Tax=Acidovorax radicis TaxID=758826 RepID=UPI001CFB0D4B|nr:hypothetical protein [Acidovorax radicis]UCV01008.1 hypothetical protein KI609_09875 [Acidovorax radicis]